MSRSRSVISLLAVASLSASLAVAQNQSIKEGTGHERRGFWIGFGFGWGSGGCTGDACGDSTSRFGGGTFRLAMGGTVNPHFKVGGELHGWVNTADQNVDETIGNMTVSAYYYPSATANFFLQGGVGYSAYNYDDHGGPFGTAEAYGAALHLGAGYDIYLGRKFSLTPILAFGAALSGELQRNGSGTGASFRPNFLSLTINPTWH